MTIRTDGALYFAPASNSKSAAFIKDGGFVHRVLDFTTPHAPTADAYVCEIARSAGRLLYRAREIIVFVGDTTPLHFKDAVRCIAMATGAALLLVDRIDLTMSHQASWIMSLPNEANIPLGMEALLDLDPVTAVTVLAVRQAESTLGEVVKAFDRTAWRQRHSRITNLVGAAMLRMARVA